MATITGHRLVVESLRRSGTSALFFLSGGPMLDVQRGAISAGIRCIDVRHEQAAAMAAHAWSRLTHQVGVCMAASGPGTLNLVTGIANAQVNCAPMVVLGGSSPVSTWGRGDFQEVDQVRLMEPITKAAMRVHRADRIPEQMQNAFLRALTGQPGVIYLDFPGDILYREVDEADVDWPDFDLSVPKCPADPDRVQAAVQVLAAARRPIVISGSGALLGEAGPALTEFLDLTGWPLFTTPQGRGIVPEDSAYTPIAARSTAFREADLVLVVGTRLNYVIGFGTPPRFAADARLVQIDTDATELARHPGVTVRLQGDAGRVLGQLTAALRQPAGAPGAGSAATPAVTTGHATGVAAGRAAEPAAGLAATLATDREWLQKLQTKNEGSLKAAQAKHLANNQEPIHPLRLCAELAAVLPREAILVADGSEILNYARHTIPTFLPDHRLNTGPFGCLGVGVPFGVGAKVARPEAPVVVLTGDGAYGLNAMELDTAAGHNLAFVVIISNNGGWAADVGQKNWRRLGFVRYDRMFAEWGVHGEFVTRPEEIRPALERALAAGRPACVNVVTDPMAHAQTAAFAAYEYA